MVIKLLLAANDIDYVNFLSRVLSDRYAGTFEVVACSSTNRLEDMLRRKNYDVALLDREAAEVVGNNVARLTLLLWDEEGISEQPYTDLKVIKKYQRISAITAQILGLYAEIYSGGRGPDGKEGKITLAWSPVGGVGKTTVALAYATWLISQGKTTIYLNLEPFASTEGVFSKNGKSMSTLFEKMGSDTGLMIQSILQTDASSGIRYFSQPENYDDIRILTTEEIFDVVKGCAENADEVVIDVGSSYDEKLASLLCLSDTVLLVSDGSRIGTAKLEQFRKQHNEYEQIVQKMILVANKGAHAEQNFECETVFLPFIQSSDPVLVFKNLSAGYFVTKE